MNAKEALVQIKQLLFSEAEKQAAFAMTEGKLVDGTIVAYDLETGEIFVVGAEGESIPAPVGEHQLETGEIVVVLEEEDDIQKGVLPRLADLGEVSLCLRRLGEEGEEGIPLRPK